MLERSRPSPLYINIERRNPVSPALIREITGEFSRLASLTCDSRNGELFATIFHDLGTTTPSPSLTFVSLRFQSKRLDDADVAPLLRRDWSPNWCQNLEVLILELQYRIPFELLAKILSSSPNLNHLVLRCRVRRPVGRQPPSEISLLQLCTLELDSPESGSFYPRLLLERINIPIFAYVRLRLTALDASTAQALAPFLESRPIASFDYMKGGNLVELELEYDTLRVRSGLRWGDVGPLAISLLPDSLRSMSSIVLPNEDPDPLQLNSNFFDAFDTPETRFRSLTRIELADWQPQPLHLLQKRGVHWLERSELVRLASIIRSRQLSGSPIQELSFVQCRISLTADRVFRFLVPRVRTEDTFCIYDTVLSCQLCGRDPCGDAEEELVQNIYGYDVQISGNSYHFVFS
ncbi:hypothetical protein AAF712_012406 [Marasmius tenuissimus]|uniref:F-box domain-containing protein n=1 Tax=Marasmius tenuissimus TaxID=585030 RepID=A0ABR2ZJ83_9AGAR